MNLDLTLELITWRQWRSSMRSNKRRGKSLNMKVGAEGFLLRLAVTILWGTNLLGLRLDPSEPSKTKPSISTKASKWRSNHLTCSIQRLRSSWTKHCFFKGIRIEIAFHIKEFTIFQMPKSCWEERWDTTASPNSSMHSRKLDTSPKLQSKAKTGLITQLFCWKTRREKLSKKSWGIGQSTTSSTT